MSLAHLVNAQDATLSNDGRFRVNYVKGCAPLSVEVTELIVINETRQFWYVRVGENEESEKKTPPSGAAGTVDFEFTEPGSYYLVQIQQQTHPLPQFDTIRIEVEEPRPPYFEASNCGDGRVWVKAIRDSSQYDYYIINEEQGWELNAGNNYQRSVNLDLGTQPVTLKGMYSGEGVNPNCDPYEKTVVVTNTMEQATIQEVRASIPDESVTIQYTLQPDAYQVLEVQHGSGAFVAQDGLLEDNQLTMPLSPSENYYCFRIRTDNRCDGTSIYSNVVCTAQLTGTTEENSNNLMFSTGNQSITDASLLRDGNPIHSFGSASSGNYEDEQIVCNTTYSYSIALTYPEGSSITEGLELQNEFSGNPPAPENLASRWDGSSVIFEFLQDSPIPKATYRAYRAEGNPPKLVNMADNSLVPVPAAAQSSCYRFGYVDACNNESALTDPICALYIRNTSEEPDVLILEWNEYTGYASGVQRYTLSKYDASGSFVRSFPLGLQTSIDLGEQAIEESGSRYMVTAYPNDAQLAESSSNLFEFRILMKGYFPTAFTPNGDELNDYFKVEGKFVAKCRLQIFNRWGEQIFETTDVEQGWDGTAKGQPAPQDTYIYRAIIETIDGGQQTQRGSVFLLRK